MKGFFTMKHITALLFFLILFFMSALTLWTFLPDMKDYFAEKEVDFEDSTALVEDIKEIISASQDHLDEDVYGRYTFLNAYGLLQRFLEKDEENNFEVVTDTKGSLHYTFFATGPTLDYELPQRVLRLREALEEHAETIFILTPDKYIDGYTEFPRGIPYPYFNEEADLFLNELDALGVPYLDFRDMLADSGIPFDDLFYRTDHHWRTETTFWAFGELVDYFNTKYGLDLDPEYYYRDIKNYNQIYYDEYYVGSMARKAGIYYAEADDFTLIFPKFITDYTMDLIDGDSKIDNATGVFEETLIYPDALYMGTDELSAGADRYGAYLYGNAEMVHVKNNKMPDGPKILFIKDSMAVPMAAFLSTVCSEIWMIDPRYFSEDIEQFALERDLDFVVVSVFPQSLTDEFFPFGIEEE